MTIAVYFSAVIGMVPVILGLVTWLKKTVRLMQPHHYAHVRHEHRKAFTRAVGLAFVGCGISIWAMALFFELRMILLGFAAFIVCFAVSFGSFVAAEKKYNGGM